MGVTVGLHIICKDEVEKVENIVNNYHPFFDSIDVAVDDEKAFQEITNIAHPKLNVYRYVWSAEEEERGFPNFDDKRNCLASKCNCDYYVRLDTDDELEKPERTRELVEKMKATGIDLLSAWYNYGRDSSGNCHAGHFRETIIANNGNYKWNKKIHENIIPVDDASPQVAIEHDYPIIHHADKEHFLKSQERNIKFLLEEYERDKDNTDSRTFSYLGRTLYTMGYLNDAKFFLEKHIKTSGWDEDKCMSWVMLAEVYSQLGQWETAVGCCHEALNERPDFPEPYIKLHELYLERKEWTKAIHWGKIALSIQKPNSFTAYDPASFSWRLAWTMAHCYMMIDDPETAYKFFKVAEKACPNLDWIKTNSKVFEDAVLYKRYIENFVWNLEFLKHRDPNKVQDLFNVIPHELKSHETLVRLRHNHTLPRTWAEDEVAIYCGQSWEDWADPSVMKGIGGSEEAVIYLSRELVKNGHQVTVFCSCGEMEGTYNGVTYKSYHEFNPFDKYSTVIAWRGNIFGNLEAKKKIIWLHDVPTRLLPKNSKDTFDKVIVLSQYHKSLLPDYIPESKIYVSRNGINISDFKVNKEVRNPYRMIYTSSYDRGIEHLLVRWHEVKKEVPQAELHLFYGWDTYDKMIDQGRRSREFKDKMVKLMNQEGVFEHGRVGHRQLIKEFQKSGIYVYPSHFEEISCISAMKAQACGCLPVTTDYAALKETVKSGVKVEGSAADKSVMDAVIKELIVALKNPKENKVDFDFSWKAVADEWTRDLLTFKRNEYKDYEDYKKHYVTEGAFGLSNFAPDGTILYHRRYQFVVESLKDKPVESIIDIGSSDGALCYAINELCKIKADGIEADEKCVKFSNEHAKKNNYNSVFYHGIAEEVVPPQKYGAVSALEVIEHVINPKEFLKKIEDMVVDGGRVFISTPDKNGYYGEKNFNAQHIHFFDKESLEELIGKERIVKWEVSDDFLLVEYVK